MTELDRGRVAALAGFAVPVILLALTVVAFLHDFLEPIGWQGGEYAYTFVWIALGSALAGVAVRTAAPNPWRSIGSGLAWAGATGLVVVVVLVTVFLWALTGWNPA
ncbi:hypothetical protein GCM10022267_37150 [Lentzea roselyniae]|uniref:Uncharacterized protein n=1 Tax=Lentzea roselyniae TaxID=531940 RepID=A0ABP7B2E0_9PSEU